jgi:hypothetical protein
MPAFRSFCLYWCERDYVMRAGFEFGIALYLDLGFRVGWDLRCAFSVSVSYSSFFTLLSLFSLVDAF